MSENTHVYIGTLPCGCNVAACVDMIDNTNATAKNVRDMIKNGYAVSRVLLADLRGGVVKVRRCSHAREVSRGKD